MTVRVLLYAMSQKGLAVLEALIRRPGVQVVAVVGARDARVVEDGLGAIRSCCAEAGIPWLDRTATELPEADLAMAVSWRWIIEVGDRPLVVFHDSLLPRYRGFNPLVTALINGDPRIGVTALLGVWGFDRGPMLGQASVPVTYPITIQAAIDAISPLYVELAEKVLDDLLAGRPLAGFPQDEALATYSLWRDEEDYRVDWKLPAARIRRQVDAVGEPYQGASCLVEGRLARIRGAEALPDVSIENRTPGKVLFIEAGQPVVVCGEGLLRITGLEEEGTGRNLLPLPHFRVRFS
jgi:methionyl-tRNA formyltransferase